MVKKIFMIDIQSLSHNVINEGKPKTAKMSLNSIRAPKYNILMTIIVAKTPTELEYD